MARLQSLKPRLHTSSSSTPAGTGWASNRSTSRHARGYGTAWDKLRQRIMERDGGLCQPHHRSGLVALATEVDHLLNRAQGGSDDEANLQAICGACHKSKTNAERQGLTWDERAHFALW